MTSSLFSGNSCRSMLPVGSQSKTEDWLFLSCMHCIAVPGARLGCPPPGYSPVMVWVQTTYGSKLNIQVKQKSRTAEPHTECCCGQLLSKQSNALWTSVCQAYSSCTLVHIVKLFPSLHTTFPAPKLILASQRSQYEIFVV